MKKTHRQQVLVHYNAGISLAFVIAGIVIFSAVIAVDALQQSHMAFMTSAGVLIMTVCMLLGWLMAREKICFTVQDASLRIQEKINVANVARKDGVLDFADIDEYSVERLLYPQSRAGDMVVLTFRATTGQLIKYQFRDAHNPDGKAQHFCDELVSAIGEYNRQHREPKQANTQAPQATRDEESEISSAPADATAHTPHVARKVAASNLSTHKAIAVFGMVGLLAVWLVVLNGVSTETIMLKLVLLSALCGGYFVWVFWFKR